MSKFNVNIITSKSGKNGPVLAGITTVSSTGSMRIPSGPTENRGGRGRGVFFGGYEVPSPTSEIQYITIATTGNGADFGDCRQNISSTGTCASSTRGISGGGSTPISPGRTSAIDYVVMSSLGGASRFGELTTSRRYLSGFNNSTRGVFCGGNNPSNTPSRERTIDYITMASTGDASDFGEATSAMVTPGGAASPTRGLFAGGYTPAELKSIDYITIASKGNGLDFGELPVTIRRTAGSSNSTRAIWAGGNRYPSAPHGTADIEYSTIATLGNALNFGTLASSNAGGAAACASSTRTVINVTATASPQHSNTMNYITIMTTGNGIDFGELTTNNLWGRGGSSDVHGGLG